jgi:hypothetical protein
MAAVAAAFSSCRSSSRPSRPGLLSSRRRSNVIAMAPKKKVIIDLFLALLFALPIDAVQL